MVDASNVIFLKDEDVLDAIVGAPWTMFLSSDCGDLVVTLVAQNGNATDLDSGQNHPRQSWKHSVFSSSLSSTVLN